MAKKVGIHEAAELTGLSKYALRKGVREGRYPATQVGAGKNSKMLFDIEMIEEALAKEAMARISATSAEPIAEN